VCRDSSSSSGEYEYEYEHEHSPAALSYLPQVCETSNQSTLARLSAKDAEISSTFASQRNRVAPPFHHQPLVEMQPELEPAVRTKTCPGKSIRLIIENMNASYKSPSALMSPTDGDRDRDHEHEHEHGNDSERKREQDREQRQQRIAEVEAKLQ
jgi:hypothetical protein